MRFFEAGLVFLLVCAAVGLMLAAAPRGHGLVAAAAALGLAAGLATAWRLARRE